MLAPAPAVTGLVCAHDVAVGRAATLLMHASGLHVLDAASVIDDALSLAVSSPLGIVVLDAAALGMRGIGVLPGFVEANPACRIVLISAFPSLARHAIAAGAAAVVPTSDLRPLIPLLTQTLAAGHAGHACTCCNPTTEATPHHSLLDRPELSQKLLREAGPDSPPTASGHGHPDGDR